MNKAELIKKVAAENDLTLKAAAAVVDSVLGGIMDSLAAREGRNPATGKTIKIAASNTPVFKPAKLFKDKVN